MYLKDAPAYPLPFSLTNSSVEKGQQYHRSGSIANALLFAGSAIQNVGIATTPSAGTAIEE